MPDCFHAGGSNPASSRPTADYQSPGGLPPGMALGCGLTSVRGNRGENYDNEPLVRQKHKKKKKDYNYDCSVSSPWRPHIEEKRMVLEHTHGLFIT
jgi:hypothetical protein